MTQPDENLTAVLAEYGWGTAGVRVQAAPHGLIHQTLFIDLPDARRFVAQRMHPVFAASVLEDIDAATIHLAAAGLTTPRLVHTVGGQLGTTDPEGHLWRVMTYLDGQTHDKVSSPEMAGEAGALVARFHAALASFDYDFRFARVGVHDTPAHLARLETVAAPSADRQLVLLAGEILEAAHHLPGLGQLRQRVTHGDLKVSNILFRGDAKAVALLDLDTLGRLPLAYELGDALRSWCNPQGEDVEETSFDVATFAAAIAGYASVAKGNLDAAEIGSLAVGLQTVCVELAARFCTDAIEDRYFGWDETRFPSRREHNRVRAVGQLHLARQVAAAQKGTHEAVMAAFA